MRAAVKSSWAFEFFRYFLTRGLVHTLSRQTQAQWDRYWFNLSFFGLSCVLFSAFLVLFLGNFSPLLLHQFRSEGAGLHPCRPTAQLADGGVRPGVVALLHQRAARQACTLTKVQLFSEIIQGTLLILP